MAGNCHRAVRSGDRSLRSSMMGSKFGQYVERENCTGYCRDRICFSLCDIIDFGVAFV